MSNRHQRLNSLLKEVIAEVISRDVCDPNVTSLITVISVEVSKDLHYAKVYVGLLGSSQDKEKTLKALQSAAGFISVRAAKKTNLRYFPSLTFYLDLTVDRQLHIHHLLEKIGHKDDPPHNP